mmetsp:Transcript_36931/g.96641  ORF Transcript_36931/g.96641 Transcript_36931/m.96641 type:complete len:235 (-) Transcript_36931:121-825(-)
MRSFLDGNIHWRSGRHSTAWIARIAASTTAVRRFGRLVGRSSVINRHRTVPSSISTQRAERYTRLSAMVVRGAEQRMPRMTPWRSLPGSWFTVAMNSARDAKWMSSPSGDTTMSSTSSTLTRNFSQTATTSSAVTGPASLHSQSAITTSKICRRVVRGMRPDRGGVAGTGISSFIRPSELTNDATLPKTKNVPPSSASASSGQALPLAFKSEFSVAMRSWKLAAVLQRERRGSA